MGYSLLASTQIRGVNLSIIENKHIYLQMNNTCIYKYGDHEAAICSYNLQNI
jgi:hypothetical protein